MGEPFDFDAALALERERLLRHEVYRSLDSLPAVRAFMEHHVWAVWDFMALLSALHNALARSQVPWRPPRTPVAVQRLLHEIVLAEATDDDPRGGWTSHFMLYVGAMEQVGADPRPVLRFLDTLTGQPLASIGRLALDAGAPRGAALFVDRTMRTIANGSMLDVAASFTYGRERIIPAMFSRVDLPASGDVDLLRTYLDRHIEVDGDSHGPLARQLVAALCTTEEDEARVLRAARKALAARYSLWSAALDAVRAAST